MDNLLEYEQSLIVVENPDNLKVDVITTPGNFKVNFEEAKKVIKNLADSYSIIAYDEDQERQQKQLNADISTIRSHIKTLEDYKKTEKDTYLKPLNEFTSQMNELIQMLEEPYNTLRLKKTEFQAHAKTLKREKIREYFDVLLMDYPLGEFKEQFYNKIYDSKWENVSTTVSTYKNAIKNAMISYQNGIESINAVGGKYVEEGIKEFQNSLSLTSALEVMQKLKKRDDEIEERNRLYLEQERIRLQKEAEEAARKKIEEEMRAREQAEKVIEVEVSKSDDVEEIPMDFTDFNTDTIVETATESQSETQYVTIQIAKKNLEEIEKFCDLMGIQYKL